MKETLGKLLIIGLLASLFTAWVFADLFPGAAQANRTVGSRMTEAIRPGAEVP